MGELIAGRYELEELIGTGGMSSVFRAHDRLLDRKVALKVLHEQYSSDDGYVERFRHEARAVAQLSHPNIVTVIDRGEQDGRQFIVFECVDGENLKELIERRGPLPVREAIELTLQIARALAFAHNAGLVHRDVKPQNVLLNEDGEAKVTDFGIARTIDVQHGLTQTGTVLGTSNYIAPEQARGERVDEHTDIYSLGVVLYELLAGEVPFDGENFVSVAMRHINEPPPSLLERRPDVPLRLDSAVMCAMAKEPSQRFDSMDHFIHELQACLEELGPEADGGPTLIAPGSVLRAGPRRVARQRPRVWPLALLVLGLLATGAVAIGILLPGTSGQERSSAAGGGTPAAARVVLHGVASYDPYGDQTEHPDDVGKATDHDPGSYWTTEHYRSFSKPGVGLVLDAGKEVEISAVTVATDTPGFTAKIRAGDRADGPFRPVSSPLTAAERTTFKLQEGTKARYYLVWITQLAGDSAHLNEVTAR